MVERIVTVLEAQLLPSIGRFQVDYFRSYCDVDRKGILLCNDNGLFDHQDPILDVAARCISWIAGQNATTKVEGEK